LKLVQLPVAEASKIHEQHPFDQVISVRLATRPPERVPATPQLDAHSFSPRLVEDPQGYHKALLRKMDFVLDLEAASAFPRKVDVHYSWGRPKYQMTQYIHKTGLLLAQISNDGKSDFLLLQNRLATQTVTLSSGKKVDTTSLENLVKNFIAFCRDETSITAFFDDLKKPKVSVASPLANAALPADSDVPPIELPPHLTLKGQRHLAI
jgi:DEP domain-containing protein 5